MFQVIPLNITPMLQVQSPVVRGAGGGGGGGGVADDVSSTYIWSTPMISAAFQRFFVNYSAPEGDTSVSPDRQ